VFITIDLNRNQDLVTAWQQKFPYGGNVPIVQVIGADGKPINQRNGLISRDELFDYLKKTGPFLDDRQLAQVAEASQAAAKALAENDYAAAAAAMGPVLQYRGAVGTVAKEAEKVGDQVLDVARTRLASATEKLAARSSALEGASELLEIQTTFRPVKEIANEAQQIHSKAIREDAELRDVFEQAKMLQSAERQVAFKNLRGAQTTYETLVRRFPNTPAAEIAQAKLADLKQ
jgi:hypothetical protein